MAFSKLSYPMIRDTLEGRGWEAKICQGLHLIYKSEKMQGGLPLKMMGLRFMMRRAFSTSSDWITVIGLEIHAQIASKAKLFSRKCVNFHSFLIPV